MKKLQLSWKWLGFQSFDFTSHFIVTFYRANTYDCYSEYLEYRLYTISFFFLYIVYIVLRRNHLLISKTQFVRSSYLFIFCYFKKFSCLSNVNEIKKHQVFLKYDDAWLWPWPMKKSGWDNDLVWMIFFVSVLLWFSVLASHHVNHFTIKRAVVFPFLSIYVYECTLIYVII